MNSEKKPQTFQTPAQTFNRRFEEIVDRFPDRVAFRLKTPRGYITVSYREAYRRARGTALGLLALNLQPGSRVAILSENRPEWVVAYLGIYISGMVAVPLDTQISPGEWRHLISDSRSTVVFASGRLLPKLIEVVRESSKDLQIISFDTDPGDCETCRDLNGLIAWSEGLSIPPSLPECRISDIVTIIYTSGTTGKPKGVTLTQSNIMGELEAILRIIRADENDALLCLLPLQHVFASIINVLVPLYLGAQVVFADTLKRSEILQALEEAGITILATVPQFFYLFHGQIQDELSRKSALVRKMFGALMRLNRFSMQTLRINLGKRLFPEVHRSFGASLRMFVSGGSSLDSKVAQDFHDMGFTILQGYGLTETTGGCTVTPVEDNVVGSVGRALPGNEVKIVTPDEAGNGEILIRGPIVMKGYYKNQGATAEAIRDGWFYSGDLGHFDAGGNLYVTGRKKEVIVLPNGKNIYPDELEAHYQQCPCIQEIAVIGVYNAAERGERLHAIVVPNFDYLKAKKIANVREILRDEIASLSNQLPTDKRLMSYQVQGDPLPRTSTRKIKRLELKKRTEEEQLRPTSETAPPATAEPEDQALMESAVGQEVVHCLRESHQKQMPLDPDMNLELDLGIDSMERIEMLSSLEQSLNLELPDDFGTDIFTVRDLIRRLEEQAGAVTQGGMASRQSWNKILSEESLSRDEEVQVPLAGTAITIFKYVCLRILYFGLFRTLLRLQIRGLENLPANGPYLICPNHQSYIDPFILVSTLPYNVFSRMFFVGYSAFFNSLVMKIVARLTNIVPVDPDAHLLRAMKAGAYGLRQGRILCIFPEGSRSFEGELLDFKKGAAILSRELAAPIVPVGIQGTYRVWPKDSLRIRPHKVTIKFGAPLTPVSSDAPDPYMADTERLRDSVSALV
jgi:long-chain acyl-CoA synthetase